MMRDEFERTMVDGVADMQGTLREMRVELRGVRDLQLAHETRDDERFTAVGLELGRLYSETRRLSDADASQQTVALGEAKAKLATREQRAWTWKHGVGLLLFGTVLTLSSSYVTARLMKPAAVEVRK